METKWQKEPCEVVHLVFSAGELTLDGKEYLAFEGKLVAKLIGGIKVDRETLEKAS